VRGVQADGDVNGPRNHVSVTLKVMTRASLVNTVSEVAAERHLLTMVQLDFDAHT